MKISVDGKDLFELNETKCKVICNDICVEDFEKDMHRRLEYILMHKHEQCMKRLKEQWMPKLKEAGVDSVPTDDDKLAELIFMQPGYKDRSTREKDAELVS